MFHSSDLENRRGGWVRWGGRNAAKHTGCGIATIARFSKVPGSSLGKICIQDKHTLVDVPQNNVKQVLAKFGDYKYCKEPVQIAVAE